ncbi:MAG: fasciclin domain-containing protein [Tannerella sp.]|jgi:hypothetical protein|nr:fasciclin domain-containing protein [Tannerella sp.]
MKRMIFLVSISIALAVCMFFSCNKNDTTPDEEEKKTNEQMDAIIAELLPDQTLSLYTAALKLLEVEKEVTAFTLFAIGNEAFTEGKTLSQGELKRHIVEGCYTVEDLEQLTELTALNGDKLTVEVPAADKVYVNNVLLGSPKKVGNNMVYTVSELIPGSIGESDRKKIAFEIMGYDKNRLPDHPGYPVENAEIKIYNEDGTLYESLLADSQGKASTLVFKDQKYYYAVENDSLSHVYSGWRISGIFASQEEIDRAPKQPGKPPVTGALQFEDTDGDGVIDSKDKAEWKYAGAFAADREAITVYLVPESFEIDYPVQVYTHPLDSRVVFVEREDGASMNVYGTKDENGRLVSVDRLAIKDTEGKEATILIRDSRPSVYYLPDGFVCQLDWDSPSSAAVTITDPTGEYVLYTYIDFAKPPAELKSGQAGRTRTAKSRIRFEDIDPRSTPPSLRANDGVITLAGHHLYLTKCGLPYDPPPTSDMGVIMETETFSYITTLAPVRVSEGVYQVTVPSDAVPSPLSNPADFFNGFNSAAGEICETYDWMTGKGVIAGSEFCAGISAALLASPFFETVPAFFMVCESVVLFTEFGCALHELAGTHLLEGAANLVDNSDMKALYRLVPYVTEMSGRTCGSPLFVEPYLGLDDRDLSVDLGGTPKIDRFYLSPSNPGEGVSYEAIADVSCIAKNSSVTMSIIGTDGYTNTITADFPDGTLNQKRCILLVPGAETGVRDYCSITINSPDGTQVTRNASLVFGW